MSCCHHYFAPNQGGDDAFTIDASMMTFGAGCLDEAGDQAKALGMSRVALFTDRTVRALPMTPRHLWLGPECLTPLGRSVL